MDALKAGYLIRYTTLDDLIRELRQADKLGNLRQKLSQYQRPHLLICDLGRPRDYADTRHAVVVNALRLVGFSASAPSGLSA